VVRRPVGVRKWKDLDSYVAEVGKG
jgi:hypothetical protein